MNDIKYEIIYEPGNRIFEHRRLRRTIVRSEK